MGMLSKLFKKKEKDRLYELCESYISCYDGGDGYWVTTIEMQMYELLKERLEYFKVIREE